MPTLRLLRQRRHARRRRTIDARRVRARITNPTSTGAILMIVIVTMVMVIPQHRMQCGQVGRTFMQRGSRGIRRVRVRAASTRILRCPEMRRIHGPHEPPMFSKKQKKRFNKRHGWKDGRMPLPTHRCVASRYCSRSIIRFLFDLSATTWPPLPPPPPASSRDKFDTCHPRCANLRKTK